MGRRVLVVEDDEAGGRLLRAIFASEGFDVVIATNGVEGLARAATDHPDIVLLDLRLPGMTGMEVLTRLRSTMPTLPVIVLTAHGEVKGAVRAIQLGAFDYLTKPIQPDEIIVVVGRALEARALRAEVEDLRRRVGDGGDLAQQMGPSPEVRRIIDQVESVAASNLSVLILGETGTGKELVAQAIHRHGDRRAKPFIALDCGAVPDLLLESELFGHERGAFTGADRRREGRFQLAEGGTLFLDEVGNLPLAQQAKLLRVLESRQVHAVGATKATPMDVRFVAATNQAVQARVAEGAFRADLFFRLAQYTISLPPLRERAMDIPHLAHRFLEEAAHDLRHPVREITPEAMLVLERHTWPGNVRELRNVIRRAVLESRDLVLNRSVVRLSMEAGEPVPGIPLPQPGRSLREAAEDAAREAERLAICNTLRETAGNKSQAARALRTDYKTLHLKMKSLGISARDFSARLSAAGERKSQQ